jgi:hypothetical protein
MNTSARAKVHGTSSRANAASTDSLRNMSEPPSTGDWGDLFCGQRSTAFVASVIYRLASFSDAGAVPGCNRTTSDRRKSLVVKRYGIATRFHPAAF